MDLEHLTKGQIILLTLLVSFMTSIATGIITVSLMAQMPAPITQTINRVVERTLERVVEKKTDAQGVVTTKEKTVVVKETDLISGAVQAALPSLAAVYSVVAAPNAKPSAESAAATSATQSATTANAVGMPGDSVAQTPLSQTVPTTDPAADGVKGGKLLKTFLARAVFTSDSAVQTDASAFAEIPGLKAVEFEIVNIASGTKSTVEKVVKVGGTLVFTLAKKSGVAIKRGDVQKVQLGNTLVVLGGEGRVQVATGVVGDIDRTDKGVVTALSLDGVAPQPGSVLVDLEGRMLAQFIAGSWLLQ
jgi:hypothetical protein